MTPAFSLCVSHGQIAVFDPALAEPFNEWTDRHYAQGFTWRPGSVSFATLDEGGVHEISLECAANFEELSATAATVIDVPFEIPPSGRIEVASIAESRLVDLPPGVYQLRFQQQHQDAEAQPSVKLTLVLSGSPTFAVVRSESPVGSQPLLLDASPA